MAVAFVVRLSNARPDSIHQFIMVIGAVMEAAVSLSEGVGFLASSDQISFRRES